MSVPPTATSMKTSTLVGVLSLAMNGVLLLAVLFWSPKSATSSPGPRIQGQNTSEFTPHASLAAAISNISSATTWERLRADDLPTFIAHLRAAGFPPSMVSAAAGALVDQRFAGRRRAIAAASEKPYWKGRDEGPDPKGRAELIAIGRDERDLLRQLLGTDDADSEEAERNAMRERFGRDLSPEKQQSVRDVQRVFDEKFSDALAKMGPGAYLPEDGEKLRQLREAMGTELAKILSPDELFDYDLRNSSTADRLRFELGALHPTEAEYRALFPLNRALDEQFPPKVRASPEDYQLRAAAEARLQEQIKAILGPDRYDEYKLSRNYDYRQTAEITQRLNLPRTATAEVYAVQRDTQQRAAAIHANGSLPAEDRNAQLAVLGTEAAGKIAKVLGADGLEAYQQHGGQWLQQFQPRPRANAKSP